MIRGKTKTGAETKTESRDLLPKMLPGTVCAQMIRCGKPNCRCSQGELHGAYYYHFVRVGGRLTKRYLKANEVKTIRVACEARREAEKARRNQSRQTQIRLRELSALLREIRQQINLAGEG